MKKFLKGLVYDGEGKPSLTDTVVFGIFLLWSLLFPWVTYKVFDGALSWTIYLVFVMVILFALTLKYGKLKNFSKAVGGMNIPVVSQVAKGFEAISPDEEKEEEREGNKNGKKSSV